MPIRALSAVLFVDQKNALFGHGLLATEDKQYIRSILCGGFRSCFYQMQNFDSDPERRFAVLLEDENTVLKWFKPAKDQVRIYYSADNSA